MNIVRTEDANVAGHSNEAENVDVQATVPKGSTLRKLREKYLKKSFFLMDSHRTIMKSLHAIAAEGGA